MGAIPLAAPCRTESCSTAKEANASAASARESTQLGAKNATTSASRAARTTSSVQVSHSTMETKRMDLNTATREDLMTIPGIGRAISRNIVEVRRERLLLNVQQARDPVKGEEGIDRAFESVDDLKFVKGIGPTKLEKLRPFLTVTPSQTLCIRSQVQQHAGILCLATWNVRNLSMKTSRGPPLPMNETKSSCQCNPSKSVATAPASTSTQDMSASAPAKAKRDLSVVAGIIQKYDVVAIQEIRDEKVAGEICRLLDGYDYILSSPVGDMLQSHREYFCYFYLKTLGLTPQVLAVPSTDNKTMVRGPFMVKFEAPSMASFVLVNVHVVYGRVEEGASAEFKEKSRRHDDIGVLNSILTSLAAIYQGPVMVLGDFNLPPFFIDEIGPRFLNFRPVLGSNHVTTIGNNLFDNIWLPQCVVYADPGVRRIDHEHFPNSTSKDQEQSLLARQQCRDNLSDHFPVHVRVHLEGLSRENPHNDREDIRERCGA